jgi:hypothetical protein
MKRIYFIIGGALIFNLWFFNAFLLGTFKENFSSSPYPWIDYHYLSAPINDEEFKNSIQTLFPHGSPPQLEMAQQRVQISFGRLKEYRPYLEVNWTALNYVTANELDFVFQYISSLLPPPLIVKREDVATYVQRYIAQYSALIAEIDKRAAKMNVAERDLKKQLAEPIGHNKTEATKILNQWITIKEWQAMVLPLEVLLTQRVAFIRDNQKLVEDFLALGYVFDPKEGFSLPENENGIWMDLKPVGYYFDHDLFALKNTDEKKAVGMGLPPSALAEMKNHYDRRLPGQKYEYLQEKMIAYNALSKTDPVQFSNRINILAEIAKVAADSNQLKNISKHESDLLHKIKKTASDKANYLRLLLQRKEEMVRYERNERNQSKDGSNPIVRVTELDALENLDPAHRLTFQHRDYIALWKRVYEKNLSFFNYFTWLEGVNTQYMTSRDIDRLFTAAEKKVDFRNGIAHSRFFTKHPHHLILDGLYIYVLDEDENLYVFPDEKSSKELQDLIKKRLPAFVKGRVYHHDVITGQPMTLCAGKLEFYQGKIKKIDNNSGHFSPDFDPHLKNAVKILNGYKAFHEDGIVGSFEGEQMALTSLTQHKDKLVKASPK